MILKKKILSASRKSGFSLIEVLVGVALIGIAMLGLAQLFVYSVLSNARADDISNGVFLAQQEIDFLRNLTGPEISALAASSLDEQLDINNDGTLDYRRITQLQSSGPYWEVRVLVFSAEQIGVGKDILIQEPIKHHIKADVSTIIGR
ncbi:MAG: prepilin-type N-terminal cleavage/methylation domain-containing protein [Candidatus Aminicenantes bacterium]|nr:prepilin-type N-terminal cleavage/methylation domain-containing protein [Candidatus Aminicenantes bacterium]